MDDPTFSERHQKAWGTWTRAVKYRRYLRLGIRDGREMRETTWSESRVGSWEARRGSKFQGRSTPPMSRPPSDTPFPSPMGTPKKDGPWHAWATGRTWKKKYFVQQPWPTHYPSWQTGLAARPLARRPVPGPFRWPTGHSSIHATAPSPLCRWLAAVRTRP